MSVFFRLVRSISLAQTTQFGRYFHGSLGCPTFLSLIRFKAVKEMMESVAADGVIPNCAKSTTEQATLEGKGSKEMESEKQPAKENASKGDCASGEDRGSEEKSAEGNETEKKGSNHGNFIDTPS